MSEYQTPVNDINFVIHSLLNYDKLAQQCGQTEINAEIVQSIIESAAKFAETELSPLNRVGDKTTAKLANGQVLTAPGWKEAYKKFCDNGWNGLSSPSEYGGQGMPHLVTAAILEIWNSSNMAFSLGALLTSGAVNALLICGSDELKNQYLPKMVEGKWSGTMNLTEPQAGSDLAAVRTRAVPQSDGSYLISGQKIFITYGDHDMTENIIHLVLARLPDAPQGVKGISLFLVPKFLLDAAGNPTVANDVQPVAVEHKLGIHGSPTCALQFGEKGGARGFLLGEANRGLEYMFVMMNEARFGVGMQGVAIAERAYQQAQEYAQSRVQGRDVASGAFNVTIDHHADVVRLLMQMKSTIEAGRMVAYHTAALFDYAEHGQDAEARESAKMQAELLIPIVKAWNTERAIENTSHALQVHGGMGYIEETGAAQHFRDARICAIYEGTTAIQANDLIGRKLGRDMGKTLMALGKQVEATINELSQSDHSAINAMGRELGTALVLVERAATSMMKNMRTATRQVFAGSVPFLMGLGDLCGAWMWSKAALIAQQKIASKDFSVFSESFYQQKLMLAEFYFQQVLPHGCANLKIADKGGSAVDAYMTLTLK